MWRTKENQIENKKEGTDDSIIKQGLESIWDNLHGYDYKLIIR